VYRLKYYDDMGKEVTDYVLKLEARIRELELKFTTPEAPTPQVQETSDITTVGIVEEEKPKKRRMRKVANTE
jgi:hypothetical protein